MVVDDDDEATEVQVERGVVVFVDEVRVKEIEIEVVLFLV